MFPLWEGNKKANFQCNHIILKFYVVKKSSCSCTDKTRFCYNVVGINESLFLLVIHRTAVFN